MSDTGKMPLVVQRCGIASLAGILSLTATPAQAADRLSDGSDSAAGIAILVVAVIVAMGLAARPGRLRTIGLLLGALGSLLGAALLTRVAIAGTFATFRPMLTPLDPFKGPTLIIDIVAAVGIAVVLAAASVTGRRQTSIGVGLTNGVHRYGDVSRVLHWLIAALILLLFPIGILMSGLPDASPIRAPLHIVHKSLGLAVFLLVIARLIWGRISPLPALSADLGKANRAGAKAAHVMLYILMLGFPISGYFMSSFYGKVTPFFFIDLPTIIHQDRRAMMPFGGLHKILLPVLFYLVIAAHIAGALKHRFLDAQDDAFQRMTG